MLTLDKVFNAQSVLKSIIRETDLVRAYGIAPECELYLKPENLRSPVPSRSAVRRTR